MARNRASGRNSTAIDRQATPAPRPQQPQLQPQREAQNVGRSTIRVAQARRELVAALPAVIHQSNRDRRAAEAARLRLDQGDSPSRVRPPAFKPKRPLDQGDSPSRDHLDMRRQKPCKSRPESNKSKGGGSRPFIPWCDR